MKSPKKGQPLSAVAILKNSFFLNEHVFTYQNSHPFKK